MRFGWNSHSEHQRTRRRCTGKTNVGFFTGALVFWCSGALMLSGCTLWRPYSKPRAASGIPTIYQTYFDYPAGSLEAKVVLEEKKEDYILRRVEFPLHLPEDLRVKNEEEYAQSVEKLYETDKKTANDLKLRFMNRIDFYIPKKLNAGEKRPVILISPILGGNMVVDHFARYYAGRGYPAAIVHRKRTFWEKEDGAGQVEDYLRTSVIRLRQAVDWLSEQPEVDPHRIGAFGISYGAILHSVLAAVEPRIRYHVLAMPAAPLADVIRDCPDKAITKLFRAAYEHHGWNREEVYERLKEAIRTDPLYLAPSVPREKIEVYIALFDRVVGVRRSFRLWKAMGKPALKILPFGHYGGILILPYLQTSSYHSFKKRFDLD